MRQEVRDRRPHPGGWVEVNTFQESKTCLFRKLDSPCVSRGAELGSQGGRASERRITSPVRPGGRILHISSAVYCVFVTVPALLDSNCSHRWGHPFACYPNYSLGLHLWDKWMDTCTLKNSEKESVPPGRLG